MGTVEVGNTMVLAQMIAEKTGSDLFEIERVTPYPEGYDACCDEALEEQHAGARPELKAMPGISGYKTIYFGFPCWWGDLPMPVYTAIEALEWNGKTVSPFNTHAGSGESGMFSTLTAKCSDVKRLVEYVTSRGVLFEQHCCGNTQAIIGDYVEMGVRLWHSAQTMNDIAAIEREFRGKLTVEGGWDSQGLPGQISASDDDIRAETRRCLEEYGREGGFILLPAMVNEEGNAVLTGKDPRLPALMDEYMKHREL